MRYRWKSLASSSLLLSLPFGVIGALPAAAAEPAVKSTIKGTGASPAR